MLLFGLFLLVLNGVGVGVCIVGILERLWNTESDK